MVSIPDSLCEKKCKSKQHASQKTTRETYHIIISLTNLMNYAPKKSRPYTLLSDLNGQLRRSGADPPLRRSSEYVPYHCNNVGTSL